MKSCSVPWIPPELISLILSELWGAPQTPRERSALLKSIALVNRTWLALTACLASRDVHIPNPLNAEGFLRLLHKRTPLPQSYNLFTIEANRVADELCRTITFYVSRSVPPSDLSEDPAAVGLWLRSQTDDASVAVSTVLHHVTTHDRLPNLRHVSLRYTDRSFADVFDQVDAQKFPPQVTHLSINYSFTRPAKTSFVEYLRSIYSRETAGRVTLPNVRHLSLSGVTPRFVAGILQVCTNVETLEITRPAGLFMFGPLPPSVRTLVLHDPVVSLSKEMMMSWALVPALEDGLFRRNIKPQIVVRSGTPDPVALMELKRSCRRFDAEVVYQRDDSSR
ncbi:hypothetical protein GSI_12883 [Ganoderma sinense ZZ0214-1]|uniref:F-box domain-containing protein n=1 Tax=Ganoderma sinense ZZ0214-1 TaxID=1077348 RepID=A0A2G8RU01_9APHY|nr:hypothetical protein GSI_12883 [Ganoderma sinense ZZ0214-1]